MAESPKKNLRAVELATTSSDELAEDRSEVFQRLATYFLAYKGRLVWGIVFGILAGVFNGVLLLVIKSVFTVILPGSQGQATPDVYYPFADMSMMQDFAIPVPDIPEAWFVAIICLSIPMLLLTRGFFYFLHQYCMLWINMKVLYRLRDESFGNLLRQSLAFFNKVKQGELIQTVSNQTRTTADAGSQIMSAFIQNPVAILSIVVVLLFSDWLYTLGALVVFPLCILPVSLIARKVRKAGGKEEEQSEGLMVTLHESFGGIRLIKAHGREEYQRERFNEASRAIVKFIIRWRKAMEISSPAVEIVGSLGISIGMVYAWMTQMSPEKFLMVNLGLMSIYPHVKAFTRMHVQTQKCFVAARKVFGYIDAEPDIRDAPNAVPLQNSKGAIQLKNVDFSYVEERAALEGVNLNFESGKKYALVGQSGSGKSTVLSLILRFYDVNSGRVCIDGKDIREYEQQSLRDQIGLVSQDTFLFHDTILNNIRYGHLEATEEEVIAAAKMAHAHEFIMETDDGYGTMLSDAGGNLSGGQRQRLSIARAILRNAPILFLDEATSALDSESERVIQDALGKLGEGKTVIAIAHRLSTVLDADEIVMMQRGQIVDVAPHEVLLERCDVYQQLYRLQFETT